MSQRDWINRPATIIFAVTLLTIGLAYTGDKILEGWVRVHDANAAYQQNAEEDRDKSADEIAEDCQDPDIVFRDCVRKNLESHYQDQATNQDLQAQQDMAYWAFWLLVASCAGIIISGFGVVLLIRSIGLGREANEKASDAVTAANQANEIMRAERRSFLSIRKIKISHQGFDGPIFERPKSTFVGDADIQNTGSSIAQEFVFQTKLFLDGTDDEIIQFFHDCIEKQTASKAFVAPNSEIVKPIAAQFEWTTPQAPNLRLAISITYFSPEINRRCQTAEVFSLWGHKDGILRGGIHRPTVESVIKDAPDVVIDRDQNLGVMN